MSATRSITGSPMWRPPIATLAAWIITPVLLVLAALFVADRLYNPEQFRIDKVEVRGRFSRVDGGRVEAVSAESISGNYFSLSLPRIEARVGELPWVFSASVRRRWPATLVVEVVEVQPVAQWGEHHWLHFTGDLVAREAGSEAGSSPVAQNLPRLSGPDDLQKTVWHAFRRWSELFAARGLRLDELRLDARGLWHLQLSLGVLAGEHAADNNAPAPVSLTVARANADARIAQFAEVLHRRLMAEFPAMRTIDLRHPNGFAIGWAPHASPQPSL